MNCILPVGERVMAIDYDPTNLGEHRDLVDMMDARAMITDETGVPLESDRRNPPEGLDFEYTACPYQESPSRFPGDAPSPTPMSGLEKRRLAESYPQIRKLLLATRAGYLGLIGAADDHVLTADDGLSVLTTMQALPMYLTERSKNSVPGQGVLPQHIVVGANCASGAIAAVGAHVRGDVYQELAEGAVLLDAAEHEEDSGLVGNKTVCAASPHMIRQFLDLLRDGSKTIKSGSFEQEIEGLMTDSELPAAAILGGHMESVLVYNAIAMNADMRGSAALANYDPNRHNPLQAHNIFNGFKSEINTFIYGYQGISRAVNIALGREADNPHEFDDFFKKNPFRFKTIALVKAKGLI